MKYCKTVVVALICFFPIRGLKAQPKPENARNVLKAAKAEAAKAHKNVFVIFHASWCVWCHRMDTAMNDVTVKPFFDSNYVITHLTIDESKDKKYLENPGAANLRTKYHGDNQGVPYWFILDKNGKLLADSRLHTTSGKVSGNNVGCPAQPDEVAYFIGVLRKTSSMTEPQLELIRKRFLKIKG